MVYIQDVRLLGSNAREKPGLRLLLKRLPFLDKDLVESKCSASGMAERIRSPDRRKAP